MIRIMPDEPDSVRLAYILADEHAKQHSACLCKWKMLHDCLFNEKRWCFDLSNHPDSVHLSESHKELN